MVKAYGPPASARPLYWGMTGFRHPLPPKIAGRVRVADFSESPPRLGAEMRAPHRRCGHKRCVFRTSAASTISAHRARRRRYAQILASYSGGRQRALVSAHGRTVRRRALGASRRHPAGARSRASACPSACPHARDVAVRTRSPNAGAPRPAASHAAADGPAARHPAPRHPATRRRVSPERRPSRGAGPVRPGTGRDRPVRKRSGGALG